MSRAHGLSWIKRSIQSGFVHGLSPFAAIDVTITNFHVMHQERLDGVTSSCGAMHSGSKWRSAVWLNAMHCGKKW